MESSPPPPPYQAAPGSGSESGHGSRPMIGFHLGIALLLATICALTGIFSCCYHWERIRRSLPPRAADHHPHSVAKSETLSVIMPGDQVPRFIALTSPREPPSPAAVMNSAAEEVKKPPRIAVPFYTVVIPY